ncbi:GerAB/ArcD/ProY family transporter [Oceanirhabdus sp. W0125-5]|uniref:GerAB/ArcD/ProY family transporter n=1 Tax=Oceanirhabdus sp. W0125-5 TaxID=2999116 RepID=UPI0022F343FA|nr:endospore germination permease [Oceanirhabdus sp. W0125-5]WBW99421.1 endospore germination permease [Oceanirhabdus sp. W0125-5]
MKEKIKSSEITAMVLLFTPGTTLLFGAGSVAKEDSWIAVIISIFLIIPIVKVYCKFLELYPGKNLFQIFELITGKWIGKILIIIYLWFAIHSTTLTFFNIVDFIHFVGLKKTPILILVICMAILTAWIVKLGLKIIGKWSVLFLFVAFVLGWTIIFILIPHHNFENIKPILSQGYYNIYLGVISVVTTSFSGLIMFTCFGDKYASPKKFQKVFFTAVLLAGGIILILTLEDVLVLGVQNSMRAHFPGYERYRRIRLGTAFQRLESVISIIFIVCEFLRASIFILAGSKALQRLFELKKYDSMVTPFIMCCVNLYFIEYQSILIGLEFLIEVWPFYSGTINILIPFGVLITAYIKKYLGTLQTL